MKGKCKRCGQDKKIAAREFCFNCYAIIRKQEKKTGTPYVFPAPGTPPAEPGKTKTWADVQLETIIKENKIKRIKIAFTMSIGISNVEVTDVT